MTVSEELTMMKPMFPKITRAAVSAANHPHESGVTFTRHYIECRGSKRPDKRSAKRAVRFSVRMSESEQRRVKQAMDILSYDTAQDFIHFALFKVAIPKIIKAAADAGTSTSGKDKNDDCIINDAERKVNGGQDRN